MRGYRKALPQVAAILLLVVLISVVTPKNSIGLLHPQSPIPTSAAYLPLAIREGTAFNTPVVYLPLAVRAEPPSPITQSEDTHGSISGTIWIWENGTWAVPQGLVTVECWDGTPGARGTLISTTYSENGYYLLKDIPPGTNYWILGYVQVDGTWYAEMHPKPVTVHSGQETQYIEPLLMPLP